MKITLKNVKYSNELSEETNCFYAKIYANGKYIGFAENYGHGGSTDIYPDVDSKTKLLYNEAVEYFKNQPDIKYVIDEKEYSIPMSLEYHIDNLIDEYIFEKEKTKLIKKHMKNSIVYIDVLEDKLKKVTLKKSIPELIKSSMGRTSLINELKKLKKIKAYVYNTNIPEEIWSAVE